MRAVTQHRQAYLHAKIVTEPDAQDALRRALCHNGMSLPLTQLLLGYG